MNSEIMDKPIDNSAAYLKNIINHLPHFIFWKDTHFVFRGCNQKFAQSAGFNSPEDIIGKTDKDMPWSSQSEEFQKDDEKVMHSGRGKLNYEEIQIQPNGFKRIMLVSKVPMFNGDDSKSVIGVLGIYTDITERKRLEQELHDANEKLENVLNTIPGHVYWKDINGVYLGNNALHAKNAGLSTTEEIIGKTDYDLSWKDSADVLRKIDKEVMESKTSKTLEESATLKSGVYSTFLTKKTPLYENGKVVGILGISIDITQHKETQKRLLEAEHKLEGMSLVSSTMAHELRTPLRSIISAASGIKKYLPSLINAYDMAKKANLPVTFIDPAHYKMLQKIHENIESEAQASFTVINILLANLKASTKGIKIQQPKTCSIKNTIETALNRYPFDLEEESQVEWTNKQDFPFKGDETLVVHILFNLLKNALYQIKAVNKGQIEIWTELGKDYNTLHFKDTAKGIPANDLPHLFDRFFTKTYHGAGIGLAFCKTVMEGMGGHIECRSEEGEFAEFILYFPHESNIT